MKNSTQTMIGLIIMFTVTATIVIFAQQNNENNTSQNNNQNTNRGKNDNRNMNRNGNMNRNSNNKDNMNSNSNNMNSNNMNSNNMNSEMNPNMNSNRTMSGSEMNSGMSDMNVVDADFAMMAAMGGNAEIKMGQLAVERSKNKNVRKFAGQMIKDHTKNGEMLKKTVAGKQIALPTEISAKQEQMYNELEKAQGDEFDSLYMQKAGVASHQEMEQLMTYQINNGMDAELKTFAEKTLPVVKKHLKMAQEMNSANGSMKNGSMR